MNLLTKILHKSFCLLAIGKIPKVGALFKVRRRHRSYRFSIHEKPNQDSTKQRIVLTVRDKASFLVIGCQEDVPLWDQWVKVLYCSYDPLFPNREETAIGWVDYLDFSEVTVADWALKWEEGGNK